MRVFHFLLARGWIIIVLVALGFQGWVDRAAVERSRYLTALEEWSVDPPGRQPASATGYSHDQRRRILPAPATDGYRWIAQTEQMLGAGDLRLERVDYENAPVGHSSQRGALYRLWLAALAKTDRILTNHDIGPSVESAALTSGPLLQLLAVIGSVLFVARYFGRWTAAIVGIAIALWFPFSTAFAPGTPGELQLLLPAILWSILPLLASVSSTAEPAERRRRISWSVVAGIAGGIALWISPATEFPLLCGIGCGGLVAAFSLRRATAPHPGFAPEAWRGWAIGGAAVILLAGLWDRFPQHLNLRIDTIHPLYALAWLGGAELLVRLTPATALGAPPWTKRDRIIVGISVLCVVPLPIVAVLQRGHDAIASDPAVLRMTTLFEGTAGPGFIAWVGRENLGLAVVALVPLAAIAVAVWQFFRGSTAPATRLRLGLALGPAIVALAFAFAQLRWWNVFDAAAISVLAICVSAGRLPRWLGAGAAIAAAAGGAWVLATTVGSARGDLGDTEARAIVSRDLAHWLAQRMGSEPGTVVAPPDMTERLHFYGDIAGLGTLDPENSDGLGAAVRIISAQLKMEAAELLQRRNVRFVVIPAWDSYYDGYVRLGRKVPADAALPSNTFIGAVRSWALPRWLRPIAYHLPANGGLDAHAVAVFEVTEPQDEATATSRLALYFLEMGQVDRAESLRAALSGFRFNLPALGALAQLDLAQHDATGFHDALTGIVAELARHNDRGLAWDQRLNVALVLAEARRTELAAEQVRICVATCSENTLRELSVVELARLSSLCRITHVDLPDPRLASLARELLPPKLRSEK